MKKILVIVLSIVILFSLGACDDEKKAAKETTTETTKSALPIVKFDNVEFQLPNYDFVEKDRTEYSVFYIGTGESISLSKLKNQTHDLTVSQSNELAEDVLGQMGYETGKTNINKQECVRGVNIKEGDILYASVFMVDGKQYNLTYRTDKDKTDSADILARLTISLNW